MTIKKLVMAVEGAQWAAFKSPDVGKWRAPIVAYAVMWEPTQGDRVWAMVANDNGELSPAAQDEFFTDILTREEAEKLTDEARGAFRIEPDSVPAAEWPRDVDADPGCKKYASDYGVKCHRAEGHGGDHFDARRRQWWDDYGEPVSVGRQA